MNPKVTLYVMGALDELVTLGIVDLAGDIPLKDREQRRDYRLMKAEGYTPAMAEVTEVLRGCMAEAVTPELLRLFRGIVEEGWDSVKTERAQMKADEAEPPDDDPRWVPL